MTLFSTIIIAVNEANNRCSDYAFNLAAFRQMTRFIASGLKVNIP